MRIHAGNGPLSYRLERMIARVEAEGRAAEDARRLARAGEDCPHRTCDRCGIYLLPGETTTCRHCDAGKPQDTE